MEKLTIQIDSVTTLTLASLSSRHFWRVHAVPSELSPPSPPEGYSTAQALDNLPQFKQQMEDYDSELRMRRIFRAIGSARLLALDNYPEAKEEQSALKKLCKRYTFAFPDEMEDPLDLGASIGEIIADRLPDSSKVTEIYLWLQEMAGGINHAEVEEILKRLRDDSQRVPDPASGGGDHGGDEQGAPDPAHPDQPAV